MLYGFYMTEERVDRLVYRRNLNIYCNSIFKISKKNFQSLFVYNDSYAEINHLDIFLLFSL